MEKNLGHATAYGYAKSKGYSGTEDEFAQLMADYASVGQSAAQSAEQAAVSATSASGFAATASEAAQTATDKASEAVTAAGTSTTKASEASTSADTASAAATSASTSAQTATTAAATATAKASEASESATTATTAKTDAESARDAAAQSASEAAESARTLTIDPTLTQSGQAADAKVVGDALIKHSISTDNAVAEKRVESDTGNITNNVNFSYVEFFVIGGDVIEYKTKRAESGIGLAFYDSDGGYVSGAQAVAGSQKINVPANATLARATYRTVQITEFGVTVCKSIEPVIDAVVGAMVKAESNSKNAENIGYSNSATYNIIRRASIYPNKRLTGCNVTTFVPTFATDATYFYADIALPENISELIIPIPSNTPAYNYLVAYTENVKVLNTNYAKLVDGTSTMTAYATIKSDGVHIKAKNLFDAGFARLAIEGLTADFNSFAIHCDGVAIPWAVTSLPENGQEKQYAGLSMFASIQCIGDSYTQGGVKSSDGNTWYQAKKPYPQVIADSLGIDVDNFGVGGASVKSYLTNGLANVLSATAPDLYMICFGINDCIHGDTIGTIADISADYTENPNTFYGNYGRIIARLKEHAPLARFVIFGRWMWDKSGQTFSNYSNAAKEIAEHFGIPFVDPFDDPFFESYVYHYTMVSGHPTQVTYTGLAYAVIRLMAKCIEENETYYRYAGLEAV